MLVDMTKPALIEEETTGAIIGSFYDVHGALGFAIANSFTLSRWSVTSGRRGTKSIAKSQ